MYVIVIPVSAKAPAMRLYGSGLSKPHPQNANRVRPEISKMFPAVFIGLSSFLLAFSWFARQNNIINLAFVNFTKFH